jgi:hypothetical protein
LIIQSPKKPVKEISGVVIPAGKTASTGARGGRFAERTHAILRVYLGALKMDQLLATHPGPNRADILLEPGKDSFFVSSPGGVLEVRAER